MCGIAMPNLIGWLPEYRMGQRRTRHSGTLEFAQLTAVKRNATSLVTLDYANDLVRITVGTDTVRTIRMPAGIGLKQPAFSWAHRSVSTARPWRTMPVKSSSQTAVVIRCKVVHLDPACVRGGFGPEGSEKGYERFCYEITSGMTW